MEQSYVDPVESLAPPSPEQMHGSVRALLEHWRLIHPESGLPGRRNFDPVNVPRLLPNIWLVDVEREPVRFRIRLLGSALVDVGPSVRVGALVDECIPNLRAQVQVNQLLMWAVTTRSPAWRNGPPIVDHDRYVTSAEVLVLPLAKDGVNVDQLVSAGAIIPH
ncbi:MAG: PAS domain-containing protein [Alphaproteobacteria bacterium]|nr:PAS domain-containing protein [Alphaproteobacteria bacterium]